MRTLIYIVVITYFLAVNAYGIITLNFQKKAYNEGLLKDQTASDLKLVLIGILGGATGIFIFTFIFRYKLKNFLIMVLLPVLAVASIYIIINLFCGNMIFYR